MGGWENPSTAARSPSPFRGGLEGGAGGDDPSGAARHLPFQGRLGAGAGGDDPSGAARHLPFQGRLGGGAKAPLKGELSAKLTEGFTPADSS